MAKATKRRVHTTKTPGLYKVDPSRIFREGGWEVRYRDSLGRTRRQTFRTKQEALDFKADVRRDPAQGELKSKGKTPFAVVAEEWFTDAQARVRPKTQAGYRDTLDRYVLPALGDMRIGQIDAAALKRFRADLPGHLSNTSKRAVLRSLTPVFELAVRNGQIAVNPIKRLGREWLPKANKPDIFPLTAEQVSLLAKEVGPGYSTLVYFAAYTGMRAGEIAALRVKNLDLLRGKVMVKEALADVSGRLYLGKPKNGESRSFSIPKFLVDMVAADLAKRAHEPADFVFPGAQGGPFRHNNFYTRHFKPAVKRALSEHLHGFRFHDLRHTCASLLIAQGVHAKAISERLGHSTINITMDIYGHLFENHDEDLMEKLESLYQEAAATQPGSAEVRALR